MGIDLANVGLLGDKASLKFGRHIVGAVERKGGIDLDVQIDCKVPPHALDSDVVDLDPKLSRDEVRPVNSGLLLGHARFKMDHDNSQEDIADVDAYVLELSGITWPDRWAPPAEVRMAAMSAGDLITYTITLVNQESSPLSHLHLQDTLPEGLIYVTSYVPGPGLNPGKLSGSTVEWINLDGVDPGETLGPFIIVARRTGSTVPPNVAQIFFT